MKASRMAAAVAMGLMVCASAQQPGIRYVGNFSLKDPAFLYLHHGDLWVTQFGLLISGAVSQLGGLEQLMKSRFAGAAPKQVASGFRWANEMTFVDEASAFGTAGFLLGDGFLVPTKTTGNVYFVPLDSAGGAGKPVALGAPKSNWFHHMALLRDMDGDGDMDVLSARVTKGLFSQPPGELVWYENPGGSDPLASAPWTTHVAAQGPEVQILLQEAPAAAAGTVNVYAGQYFSSELTVTALDAKTGKLLGQRNIDPTLGHAYNVLFADLDADGAQELVVNTHEGGSGGGVYAYRLPSDPLGGNWSRITLNNTAFPVTEGGMNQASPGFIYPFYPKVGSTGRPWILVAGDGAQSVHVMIPQGAAMEYEVEEVLRVPGVVGSLAIGDVDGDGFVEVFAPCYDDSVVHVLSFYSADAPDVRGS